MRSEKSFLVQSICEMIQGSEFVYFVSYAGLTVANFSALRNQLAAANVSCHVLKNSLIKKAAAKLELNGFDALDLKASTAMVYGKGDCSVTAKLLLEFGKKNAQLAAKGGYMDGAVLSSSDMKSLAELPAKPVLQAMLLGVLQAPSRNLVTVLNAKAGSIVNVVNAYKEKLEKSN